MRIGIPAIGGIVLLLLDWKSRFDEGISVIGDLRGTSWFYLVLIAALVLIAWDIRRKREVITISFTSLAIAILLSAAAVGAWGWYALDRFKGPIRWTFDEASPLDWQRPQSGPLLIIGFQIKGKNTWDTKILPSRAYIDSSAASTSVPLNILSEGNPIPLNRSEINGGADFILTARLRPQLQTGDFLARYSEFSLTFEYQGGRYIRHFSQSDVKRFVSLIEFASQPKPPAKKGVELRSS